MSANPTVNNPTITFDPGPPPTATLADDLTVAGSLTVGGVSVSSAFTVPSGTTLTSSGAVDGPYGGRSRRL